MTASSEEFPRASLLAQLPAAIVASDRDGRVVLWNRHAEELFGWTAGEALGRDVVECTVVPSRRAQGRAIIRRVLEGESWKGQFDAVRRDGTRRAVSSAIVRVRDDHGRVAGAAGVTFDITPRREAEAARRWLTQVLEATSDFVGTTTQDGLAVYINRAGRRLIGLGPDDDVAGIPISEFMPEWAWSRVRDEGIPTALRAGTWHGETALLSTTGDVLPVSHVLLAHRDPEGEVTHLSTIARDLTSRLADEEQRRREAIGRLSGGIAHDFNNLLTVVQGYTELLEGAVAGNPAAAAQLSEIRHAAERASALVDQLLAFGGIRPDRSRAADLGEPRAEVRGGTETVLVVEQQASVRSLIVEALSQHGYRVLDCASAVDAMELAARQEVNALLVSPELPTMTGHELAERLRDDQPDLRVLVMSAAGAPEAANGTAVIAKPFGPAELLVRIRALLDEAP